MSPILKGMEIIKLIFQARIIRSSSDSFSAILSDNYLIKFKDSKLRHYFNVNDLVNISIENSETIGREEVRLNHMIIYCILNSFLSNGFMFRDTEKQRSFFWTNRGLITHKKFETDDYFEENDILKIVIRKI